MQRTRDKPPSPSLSAERVRELHVVYDHRGAARVLLASHATAFWHTLPARLHSIVSILNGMSTVQSILVSKGASSLEWQHAGDRRMLAVRREPFVPSPLYGDIGNQIERIPSPPTRPGRSIPFSESPPNSLHTIVPSRRLCAAGLSAFQVALSQDPNWDCSCGPQQWVGIKRVHTSLT